MNGHYPERLQEKLEAFRPETVETIGRWCRVGRISMQAAVEFVELLEDDRQAQAAEEHYDEVFGGYVTEVIPAGFPIIPVIEKPEAAQLQISLGDLTRVDL